MENFKLKQNSKTMTKINEVSVGWDKGTFHQFSFSKYDDKKHEWTNYKGSPVKEYFDEDEIYNNGDRVYKYSIITPSILNDSPMYDSTLDKMMESIFQDWKSIENDLPECVKVIEELTITVHYNNYGSTFIQWTFDGRKIREVENLYEVFKSINLYEYPSTMELLYDFNLVGGYYDMEGSTDEERQCEFRNILSSTLRCGYELSSVDEYIDEYSDKIPETLIRSTYKEVLKNSEG